MKTKMFPGLMLATAIVVGGCTVTSKDIENWKTTQKGPEKLAAVLLDDRYDPQLRAEAAWALASIEDWDKYDKAFKVIENPARSRIVDALVPILIGAIKEGNPPPSPPTAEQVSAKDALFVVAPMAEGAAKTQAEDVLVEWCISDFNNRFFAGRYSIEVVLTGIGPRAAEGLVDTLKPGFLAYDKVTELLAKLGTKEAKEQAGKNLVAVARTREGKVEEALLVAIGRMGGKEAREFLLELGANLKIPARVQRGGLMAYLQYKMCDKEDLPRLFLIAEDANQDYMSRNFAYDAIVCTGDKTKVPRLYKLLHEVGKDKDRFRGVGVDEILKLGGPETIAGIVGEIGAEKDPWENFEDLRDFVMLRFTQDDDGKPLDEATKKKVLEQIRPLVKSKETLSRAIAVFTLGLIGESSDAGMLKKYTTDGGKLTEWKAKEGEIMVGGGQILQMEAMEFAKVGDVATWALAQIEKRK